MYMHTYLCVTKQCHQLSKNQGRLKDRQIKQITRAPEQEGFQVLVLWTRPFSWGGAYRLEIINTPQKDLV